MLGEGSMHFGLFTCGYQHTALETAFVDAAAFKYDYIELWGGRPHAYAPDLMRGGAIEIVRLAERYAMPVRVYTPEHNAYPFNYMLGSDTQWKDSIDYLTLAVEAGASIGAAYTLISCGHGGNAPYEERWQRLIQSLKKLTGTAERLSHAILLETLTPYESNTCTTLNELKRVIEEVNSPCLFGMCDVVAPFIQGENPADYATQLGSSLRHMHLVDSDGLSEDHLLPGDGIMPLKRILRDMYEAGYDSTATIELVTKYMHDPTASAKTAIERVRKL
jgi:protein FrlC